MLVTYALQILGGTANLQVLYAKIEELSHPGWLGPNWKAKVRQVVQKEEAIERVSRGVWRVDKDHLAILDRTHLREILGEEH